MVDHDQLAAGRLKISAEFVKAVRGPATQRLSAKDPQAAALGQHLQAATAQRGLHGTAAAIDVLAQTADADALDYARRLVHYLDQQSRIEELFAEPDVTQQQLDTSQRNVIKMSEVLYALASVQTSLAPREQLAAHIAEVLVEHRNADGGWPYFMTAEHKESHLLPTAYAVRALASHGYDINLSAAFLLDHVRNIGKDRTDIFIQVLAIYVLCYLPEPHRKDREIRRPFQEAWRSLSPLLSQDLEANIEYVTNRINYIRVPWQLYLLASAAKLSPYRRFSSATAQRRLKSILISVKATGGLLYPHSGRDLSSRTNAILFDVLKQIDDELKVRRLPLRPFVYLEMIKSAVSSRAFQYVVRVLVLALVAYAVVRWSTSRQTNVTELAPELVSSVLLILLIGKRD